MNEAESKLESITKDILADVHHCDEQILFWQNKKSELQKQVNDALVSIQKEMNNEPTTKTIPELIRSFLEKNGPARSKDIRNFLLAKGKKTSPGVALGRMVKSSVVKNVKRGVYTVG